MAATKTRILKTSGSVTYKLDDRFVVKRDKQDFIIKSQNSINIILKEVI